jgi:hypothetical protein
VNARNHVFKFYSNCGVLVDFKFMWNPFRKRRLLLLTYILYLCVLYGASIAVRLHDLSGVHFAIAAL